MPASAGNSEVESAACPVGRNDRRRLATLDKNDAGYYVEYQKEIEEYAAERAPVKVKVFPTEAAACMDEMLDVHGGYGCMAEYPIEQLTAIGTATTQADEYGF